MTEQSSINKQANATLYSHYFYTGNDLAWKYITDLSRRTTREFLWNYIQTIE